MNWQFHTGPVLLLATFILIICVKHKGRRAHPMAGPVLEERHGLVFDVTYNDLSPMESLVGGVPSDSRRARLAELGNVDLKVDYNAAFAAAYANAGEPRESPPLPPLSPYTLDDAVREAEVFDNTFALFVYDPTNDHFVGMYSNKHSWTQANEKLFMTMKSLAFMLRRLFPERFTPSSPELVLAIASGDYPQVKLSGLPHENGAAPVLMFGSAFRDEGLYPNMVPMPVPDAYHLLCFQQWVAKGTVCRNLKPNRHEHGETVGLEFSDENGLDWDDLIPQLIWRGSNFPYLPRLTQPRLTRPYAYKLKQGERNTNELATKALRNNYDSLSPRWKGVVLSAESELEAEGTDEEQLPWANIKFPNNAHRDNMKYYLEGNSIHTLRGRGIQEDIIKYDDTGVSKGEYLRSGELVKYKYHVDLGGGGGTTWTGTVQKLAMPGLLFHHVTPTKDYFHDRLVPWRHYIPVSEDLRDLRSKFDWAESHPREAKWIANQGAAFMRYMGSEEGFNKFFREDLVAPLRRAIEAYQPVDTTHPGRTWRQVLEASPEGIKMKPITECSGVNGSCHPLDADRKEASSLVYGLYRA